VSDRKKKKKGGETGRLEGNSVMAIFSRGGRIQGVGREKKKEKEEEIELGLLTPISPPIKRKRCEREDGFSSLTSPPG